MADLSIVVSATGQTTAAIGGYFNGGDSSYSYQRFIRVTITGWGSVDIYSEQSSGGYNTFSGSVSGLSPGTTYSWTAVLYYRTTGGWSATSYTDSGVFTTDSATYYTTIVYSANGGSGAPSSQTFSGTSSSVVVTLSSVIPTRSGYTFLGWSTSSTATAAQYYAGTTYYNWYGSTGGYTTTLYAVWQLATYSVTVVYNANGGTGAPASQTVTGTTQYLSLTLSSVKPTRSGYTFLGWSTSSTATAATYYAGQTLSSVYATTSGTYWYLYAVWAAEDTGIARIYYNGAWKKATPYVYYNGAWKKAIAHIYYNGAWKKGK